MCNDDLGTAQKDKCSICISIENLPKSIFFLLKAIMIVTHLILYVFYEIIFESKSLLKGDFVKFRGTLKSSNDLWWCLYNFEKPYLYPNYNSILNLIQQLWMYFWRENLNSIFDPSTRNWLKNEFLAKSIKPKTINHPWNVMALLLLQNDFL